jgi:hypothetical protein
VDHNSGEGCFDRTVALLKTVSIRAIIYIVKQAARRFAFRENPQVFEINALAWLYELSQKAGRTLTLGDVPSGEWARMKSLGMDLIWLMGVWTRSPGGRQISFNSPGFRKVFDAVTPGWKSDDVVGSSYSISSHDPDPRVGTWEEIDLVRKELHKQGVGLVLDFIPNHTGIDHHWLKDHPEYFVQVKEFDYLRDKETYFTVESFGSKIYVAHGKDPYFPAWTDTAQLNYFNPEARAAVIERLKRIAAHADGVRCDMAMLILNDVFRKTWGWANEELHIDPPAEEFWTQAIRAAPDLIYIAEAYWDTEWTLQTLGFDYTYDKRLYDRMRSGTPHDVYLHLKADIEYQRKLVRFIENHDEGRSIEAFGRERLPAVGTLFSTLPGMKLYFQGQLEGKRVRMPLQIRRTGADPVDREVENFYKRLLPVVDQKMFHGGTWELKDVGPDGDDTWANLIAYMWRFEDDKRLVLVNLTGGLSRGRVALRGDVLNGRKCCFLNELNTQIYAQNEQGLADQALRVSLHGYEAQILNLKCE